MAALQKDDEEVVSIIMKMETHDPTTKDRYIIIESGRLYRIRKGRWKLYLPADFRYDIVSTTHRELIHLGIDKTLSKINENFYFTKMRAFVTKYVNKYKNCLFYKIPKVGELYLNPLDERSRVY